MLDKPPFKFLRKTQQLTQQFTGLISALFFFNFFVYFLAALGFSLLGAGFL